MSFIDLNDPLTLAEIALIVLAGLALVWQRVLKKGKKKTSTQAEATQPLNHKDGTLWQLTRIANALEVITGASANTGDVTTRAEALVAQLDALPASPIPPSVLANWVRESVLQQKKA